MVGVGSVFEGEEGDDAGEGCGVGGELGGDGVAVGVGVVDQELGGVGACLGEGVLGGGGDGVVVVVCGEDQEPGSGECGGGGGLGEFAPDDLVSPGVDGGGGLSLFPPGGQGGQYCSQGLPDRVVTQPQRVRDLREIPPLHGLPEAGVDSGLTVRRTGLGGELIDPVAVTLERVGRELDLRGSVPLERGLPGDGGAVDEGFGE